MNMKIKMFQGLTSGVEHQINEWLANNKVNIKFVTQSSVAEGESRQIHTTISIWYIEIGTAGVL